MVCGIPSYKAADFWPLVETLVGLALEYDLYETTTDDILDRIEDQQMQLWLCGTDNGEDLSIAVTEIDHKPNTNVCRIVLLAGSNLYEWLDEFLGIIEDWARVNACSRVETVGRRGWEKVGKTRGYDYAYTVLSKKIGE